MPITGTPTPPRIITRDQIRRFMRDVQGPVKNTGVINILLDNVEFSDDDVEQALDFTKDKYNYMTPLIGIFSINAIPKIFLLYGVAAYLLNSEAIRQLRNQATTQDGDVQPIGIDDKFQLYRNASDWMREQFETMAQRHKIQLDMQQAFGGLGSGYANTARNHNA